MKIPVLDLKPQYQLLKPEIDQAIANVLESTQFVLGPEVKLLETEIADYLGVKHAIGVNSGTDALIIALRALNIGIGDEVITTSFSFYATAESISLVGAKPIFVDIEEGDFNINSSQIKDKITSKTKAIMPVHLYGQPAAMTEILTIAKEYGLKVIEDCAQAFGAVYYGDCLGCHQSCEDSQRQNLTQKYVGGIGDVGAYSFYPTKNLGAYGDGGMIVTNNDDIAELAKMLRVHGAKKNYHNELVGYNSRLDSLQACVLRVKLKYINQWNEARRNIAKNYNHLLANNQNIITPNISKGHVFHQYTIRVKNGKRDELKEYLAKNDIGSMIYYPIPQDQLPVYQEKYQPNPITMKLAGEVLSLPIFPELSLERVTEVAQIINSFNT
ncbi:MAG: DegT/DnrJ/EryC1/StrS family aminotransferase [Cyanobacteria bacterium]|nr:DegT/DnrJ/EryC1/StrS family aminotransferase [Cyanobacteria bacterium CG_2015-16_32_12]NCO77008.1 DegT/DnrJ/EryC1/StrS family aminotransferase [Cyanobacteria bacterium CG_2015-22_32_23]NCQ03732.1 DegT/DnrJ/EryC1/StrS family aminotransferase [Cyanobacteria bacterium CG_2015-09_32_10]NCQ40604.1 DegT/DnrJ/EryC1/StrS family aminotransferase [Cyanobacteria bacterium CG_2015-04_32_10]